MTAETVLARGRARAESLHTGTFDVFRPTGKMIPDPDNPLAEVPELATKHSGIHGKFKSGQAQPRDVQTPGQKVADTSLEWHCSVAVTDILTDDIVACVTSPTDPEYAGVRVRVAGPFLHSYATARRFPVTRLT